MKGDEDNGSDFALAGTDSEIAEEEERIELDFEGGRRR